MKCTAYTPMQKGALLGFATLEMSSGMILRDCSHCLTGGREWVGPPSKPRVDANGCTVEKDGKRQYVNVVTFATREIGDKWSEQAVRAIRQFRGAP